MRKRLITLLGKVYVGLGDLHTWPHSLTTLLIPLRKLRFPEIASDAFIRC